MKAKMSPMPWRRSLVDETVIIDANGDFVACMTENDEMYHESWGTIEKNTDFVLNINELIKCLEKAVNHQGFSNEELIKAKQILADCGSSRRT